MSGDVLVINAGSSSIKFSLFGPGGADGPESQMAGQVEGIGTAPHAIIRRASKEVLIDRHWPDGDGPRDHDQTMAFIMGAFGAPCGLEAGRGRPPRRPWRIPLP